ncbi:hypothetical protein IQ231_05930 [Cuspidothrix issatschenkoi LEGE 03284]|nr:hypothetical protein [Cuspidothrix issatschenkoi]MBE9231237.1 hypothetical protein [Cuspidothrix issatschenkoi LEGE 03284]
MHDIKTGDPVKELKGHGGGIYEPALSRDDKTLYSASGDKSIKVEC